MFVWCSKLRGRFGGCGTSGAIPRQRRLYAVVEVSADDGRVLSIVEFASVNDLAHIQPDTDPVVPRPVQFATGPEFSA